MLGTYPLQFALVCKGHVVFIDLEYIMAEINIKQDIPIYYSEELNILEDDTKFIAWLQKYHGSVE